jgi:hypothetical protein
LRIFLAVIKTFGHGSQGKVADRPSAAIQPGLSDREEWLSGSIFRKTSRVSGSKDDKALFRNLDEPTDLL